MDIRRIVLIHPGREGLILGRATGAPYTLMRLASLVPPEIPVEIWDENLESLDAKLRGLGPHDLVGITSKTLAIESAERMAGIAHSAGVQAVVVGGAHATLAPEDLTGWADVVVTGEAYSTWPQLIQDFTNDRLQPRYHDSDWVDLAGVAPITDRVIRMVDENRRYWTPMIEITRGCPRNCSYCFNHALHELYPRERRHYRRTVDDVIGEAQEVRSRWPLEHVVFVDDLFIVDKVWLKELAAKWPAAVGLPFFCNVQASLVVKQPELIALLKRAGCHTVSMGIESADDRIRTELLRRRMTRDEIVTAGRLVRAAGMHVTATNILGLPTSTLDLVRLQGAAMTGRLPSPGSIQH